jgi:hypothetical protein
MSVRSTSHAAGSPNRKETASVIAANSSELASTCQVNASPAMPV